MGAGVPLHGTPNQHQHLQNQNSRGRTTYDAEQGQGDAVEDAMNPDHVGQTLLDAHRHDVVGYEDEDAEEEEEEEEEGGVGYGSLAEDQRRLLPHGQSSSPSSSLFANDPSSRHLQMSSQPPPSYSSEAPMRYPPPALDTDPPPATPPGTRRNPRDTSTSSTGSGSQPNPSWTTSMKDLLTGKKTMAYTATSTTPPEEEEGNHPDHVAINIASPTSPIDHHHPLSASSTGAGGPAEGPDFDVSERRCRICLEPDDDPSSELGQLISPCLCKGSSRYIHLGCLQKWRDLSPRKESSFSCDTCHYNYSFSRPWMAQVLSHEWFLHVITVVMFTALCYGASWCGRELNNHGIWEWKKTLVENPELHKAVTVLGLDWMDIVWGFGMVAGLGLLFLLFGGCSMLCSDDENGRNNANNCGSCGGCGPCYFGDCGAASGGEGLVIIFLVIAFLAGIFGAFIGIYRIMAKFNGRALASMKETILEVK